MNWFLLFFSFFVQSGGTAFFSDIYRGGKVYIYGMRQRCIREKNKNFICAKVHCAEIWLIYVHAPTVVAPPPPLHTHDTSVCGGGRARRISRRRGCVAGRRRRRTQTPFPPSAIRGREKNNPFYTSAFFHLSFDKKLRQWYWKGNFKRCP